VPEQERRMKLTNLKLSASEAKVDAGAPIGPKQNLPRYPYGMELRLDTEALDKLKIDLADYKVGETCMIEAKCLVTRMSESQSQGGKDRRDLKLQITDIAFSEDKAAKKASARDRHLASIASPTR
jgi:hypothetical protein